MREKELLEGICEAIERTTPKDHHIDVYDRFVGRHLDRFTKVTISEGKYAQLNEFVTSAIERKRKENGYKEDSGSLEKRYYTGWGGECAVEQFLNIPSVDFSIGDSRDYDVPDLIHAGFEVGVKTVNVNDFPLIRKPTPSTSNTPQIIVLRKNKYDYYICGLATYDVVNNVAHFDNRLIRSEIVRRIGIKSAFYRFDLLTPLSIKALSPYRASISLGE